MYECSGSFDFVFLASFLTCKTFSISTKTKNRSMFTLTQSHVRKMYMKYMTFFNDLLDHLDLWIVRKNPKS